MEVTVPQIVGQFFASLVDVPVPQILKESVGVLRLVPCVHISELIFDQIVEVTAPPVAKQFFASLVDVPVRQILKEGVGVLRLVPCAHF